MRFFHQFSSRSRSAFTPHLVSLKGAGFTLIELLIVIGILAILATVVVLVLNPAQLFAQARDSRRVSDLQTLNSALKFISLQGLSEGTANTVYVSIPDSSATCANLGLPTLPAGYTYACATSANFRKVDGTGWIPVNFAALSTGSPLATLPIDPINTTSTGNYYTYVTGGSWALGSLLESQKHLSETAFPDGGTDAARFELGTDLDLWADASGLAGYWKFDEGVGTSVADSSGNGNTGTASGGIVWVDGKHGKAIQFPITQNVAIPDAGASSLDITQTLTIAMWFYPTADLVGYAYQPISKWTGTDNANFTMYYFGTTSGENRNVRFIGNLGGAWAGMHGGGYVTALNTWHHVVLSYSSSSGGQMYVNGQAVGSIGGSGVMATNNATMYIGSAPSIIDEVRVYNRAFTPAEVAALYNATR